MPLKDDVFPVVTYAEGAVSDDGRPVLCRLKTIEHGPLHFGLKIGDVHDLATFLLRLVAGRGDDSHAGRAAYQTIPVAAIRVGELDDGNGCLEITVGGRALAFEIAASALPDIRRTLTAPLALHLV